MLSSIEGSWIIGTDFTPNFSQKQHYPPFTVVTLTTLFAFSLLPSKSPLSSSSCIKVGLFRLASGEGDHPSPHTSQEFVIALDLVHLSAGTTREVEITIHRVVGVALKL